MKNNTKRFTSCCLTRILESFRICFHLPILAWVLTPRSSKTFSTPQDVGGHIEKQDQFCESKVFSTHETFDYMLERIGFSFCEKDDSFSSWYKTCCFYFLSNSIYRHYYHNNNYEEKSITFYNNNDNRQKSNIPF